MAAWQSMRSAPDNGEYILAVRWVEIGDDDHFPDYQVICWEDWDEPGWYNQDGEAVSGFFSGWMHLPEPPVRL